VQHALNCTYTDYRNQHFEDCVRDPSEVYRRPGANPDDTGFVDYDRLVLFAGLNGGTRMIPIDP